MTEHESCLMHQSLEDKITDLKESVDELCKLSRTSDARYETKTQNNFKLSSLAAIFFVLLLIVYNTGEADHREVEELKVGLSKGLSDINASIKDTLHTQSLVFKDDFSGVRSDFRELKTLVEVNHKMAEKRFASIEDKHGELEEKVDNLAIGFFDHRQTAREWLDNFYKENNER